MTNTNIDTCTACGKPAHASETNDDGMCMACMRAAGADPILPDDSAEECETCGGDGVVTHEVYRGARDVETEERCPDCDGAGRVTDDGPDFDPDDRRLPTEDHTGLREPGL